ncbi:SpoIIE family protein phosphatase [Streptomyces sp. NPDC004546]|uniref:SpoIIE family protein phosphatase n=1 Tax=Streptomyces sp. NPDC004546 TaxID=3154282 RepID=UPI0033B67168
MGSSLCRSIHDVTGHDVRAAVSMSQVRNVLRGIACDRREPPNVILRRFGLATTPCAPIASASPRCEVVSKGPKSKAELYGAIRRDCRAGPAVEP